MFTDGQMEIVNQTLEGDDKIIHLEDIYGPRKFRANWYL